MIAIINVSTNSSLIGWQYYEIRINEEVITYFKHKREDGLAKCLQRASEAVEKASIQQFSLG